VKRQMILKENCAPETDVFRGRKMLCKRVNDQGISGNVGCKIKYVTERGRPHSSCSEFKSRFLQTAVYNESISNR